MNNKSKAMVISVALLFSLLTGCSKRDNEISLKHDIHYYINRVDGEKILRTCEIPEGYKLVKYGENNDFIDVLDENGNCVLTIDKAFDTLIPNNNSEQHEQSLDIEAGMVDRNASLVEFETMMPNMNDTFCDEPILR